MRIYILAFLGLFLTANISAQTADSCQLVGIYALDHLEMSQEIDSMNRKPSPRWSLYEQSGLVDSLKIQDGFGFVRSMNFRGHFERVLTGQFKVKQDSILALNIVKGQLYTMPNLLVERVNLYELVIIEKFKSRWIRRSYRSNLPIRP